MKYAFRPTQACFLITIAVLAMLVAVPVSAQVIKGSISGTAVDPSGAAVPGAQIRAVNTATAQVFTTSTENNGSFRLNLLPVGTYTVEVTKSGFRKTAVSNVAVNSNVDNALPAVKLEVGVATEAALICAPGTAAPDGSTAVPEIEPLITWAETGTATNIASTAMVIRKQA